MMQKAFLEKNAILKSITNNDDIPNQSYRCPELLNDSFELLNSIIS